MGLRVKMQKIYFVLFSVVICSPWYQNLGNDWDDQMIDRSIHEKKVNNINKTSYEILLGILKSLMGIEQEKNGMKKREINQDSVHEIQEPPIIYRFMKYLGNRIDLLVIWEIEITLS